MASATPDLRLPSQLALVPNLHCFSSVQFSSLRNDLYCVEWDVKPLLYSSVQFGKINVVLSAKALQDHDTVISVIDAVVAGKEMSSGVAGMRTQMVRR